MNFKKNIKLKKILFSLTFIFLISACGSSDDGPTVNSINFDITATGVNSNVTLLVNTEELLVTATDGMISGALNFTVNANYLITYSSSTNQLCRLDNNQGTILSDTETIAVNINCLNWDDPSDFNDKLSISSEDTTNIDVAISNNGDSVVVWQQSNGSNTQIFMSEYRNGVLTNPSSLGDNISPNGTDAKTPKVSMNDSGDTVITWIQFDGTTDQVFKSEYRNNTWTHPADEFDNISVNNQFAFDPDVSINNSGETVIVWAQPDGSREQIFKSEFRNNTWTHPSTLMDNISPDGGSSEAPLVAINNSGDTVITWKQFNTALNLQVFKSEFRNDTWVHPIDLDDNISLDGTSTGNPDLDLNDSGETLITWSQSDTVDNHIYLSEYRNSSWSHPVDLNDHISPDGRPATTPKLALSDNSEAVIVWQGSNIANNQIFMSEFRNGSWNHPVDLQDNISFDGTNARKPQVTINSLGETFISWQQFQVIREQIYRSEYRNGVWQHPQNSSETISLTSQAAENSVITSNNSGEALILWEQVGGSSLQVYQSSHR